MTLHITTSLLGVGFAITILALVRRDHLHISHALFWLAFAGGGAVFGVFPGLSDYVSSYIGISYGPTLVLVIAVCALVLRCLQADILASRMERDIRRLSQDIALSRAINLKRIDSSVEKPE